MTCIELLTGGLQNINGSPMIEYDWMFYYGYKVFLEEIKIIEKVQNQC